MDRDIVTIIIVTPPATPWVVPTADILRDRGMKVVCLGTLSIIGFLLMSERVSTLVIHEDSLPDDWAVMRERMQRIAPATKIRLIPRAEERRPSQIADSITADRDEPSSAPS